MNARSEGDETPLWLDARSGGINASGLEVSRERNFQRARRARRHSCAYVEGTGANVSVGRSGVFMNNLG